MLHRAARAVTPLAAVSRANRALPLIADVRRHMSSIAPTVTLREITASTVRTITSLAVKPDQMSFVATNAESLAQALFAPEAWYRACLLYTSPSPRDRSLSRMPSSA